jgi:predicted nucleotidyltransferase
MKELSAARSLSKLDASKKEELRRIMSALRQELPELATRFQVESLLLFGSFVQGWQRKRSDLDILVEFSEVPTLFQFLALERYLGELLGIKVDLVMKEALKPRIGKHILAEAIPV